MCLETLCFSQKFEENELCFTKTFLCQEWFNRSLTFSKQIIVFFSSYFQNGACKTTFKSAFLKFTK